MAANRLFPLNLRLTDWKLSPYFGQVAGALHGTIRLCLTFDFQFRKSGTGVSLGGREGDEHMAAPMLERMCPNFIVSNVDQTIAFYRDKLGFESWHQEPRTDPFFAIVGRDKAMLFVKAVEAEPLPNHKRHAWMKWDSYVSVNDPDALAAEFADRGTAFSEPLKDTSDGLRGFEITDPDGYILFFGRPRETPADSN
jgi:catechol 2,3-dioxygenase-like lactoylglutathione lyase family enzyme